MKLSLSWPFSKSNLRLLLRQKVDFSNWKTFEISSFPKKGQDFWPIMSDLQVAINFPWTLSQVGGVYEIDATAEREV